MQSFRVYGFLSTIFMTHLLCAGTTNLKEYYIGNIKDSKEDYKENLILNERLWLTQEYLPLLEGRVLFVGVQNYNQGYHNCVVNPELFETIDIDENVRKFGSPYAHYTSDVRFFNPGYQYDHICLFACLAMHDAQGRTDHYTVSTKEETKRAIANASSLVKQGGTILIDMITSNKSVYRKNLGHIDEAFWDSVRNDLLTEYKVIFRGYSPDHDERMLWWARKI